jgi:hypothetical protein
MPSPFPGMDPYIEAPKLWSDFHANLATEIQTRLNQMILPKYVARLTPLVTYEVVEIGQVRGIRPDVGVWRLPGSSGSFAATAVLTPAPVESEVPLEVPLTLNRVEIRTTEEELLVTVVEILSPVNKRPGHDTFLDYRRKRRDLLRSAVHLVEIDLLRAGERPPLEKPVPRAPYYCLISRAERRPKVEVWPIQLADSLPELEIPLLEPEVAPLDLGAAVASVYERCGYAVQIDYRQPPPPPLSPEEAAWIEEHLGRATPAPDR